MTATNNRREKTFHGYISASPSFGWTGKFNMLKRLGKQSIATGLTAGAFLVGGLIVGGCADMGGM